MAKLKARPSYSVRPFRPQRKFTSRLGILVPFLHQEVVTGDIIKIRETVLTKTESMITPLQHDLVAKTYYMFIPNRLIMKDWKEFRTGNSVTKNGTYGQNESSGEFTLHPPRDVFGIAFLPSTEFNSDILSWNYEDKHLQLSYGTINAGSASSNITISLVIDPSNLLPLPDIHSLGDYFGMPQFELKGGLTHVSGNSYNLGVSPQTVNYENSPNLSWFFDYWLVWNEFFRDPDLQDPVPLAPAVTRSLESARDYNYLANERFSAVSGESDNQYSLYRYALNRFVWDHASPDVTLTGTIKYNSTSYNLANYQSSLRENLGARLSYGKINPYYPALLNYERDYFIGARPFDIRGIEPLLPISGVASINNLSMTSSDAFANIYSANAKQGPGENIVISEWLNTNIYDSGVLLRKHSAEVFAGSARSELQLDDTPVLKTGITSDGGKQGYTVIDGNGMRGYFVLPPLQARGITMSGTGSGTASIVSSLNLNELKLAQRLQNYLTRLAFTGERYQDYLLSLFGVAPSNAELQRPFFVGGHRAPVIVQEVTQTSASSGDSFLGDIGGKAASLQNGYVGTLRANEDGFLLALYCCYPRLEWNPQGIDKKYLRRNRYDYFNQMFDNIPPQPVQVKELYVTPEMSEDEGNATFGYRQAWDDLRRYQNKSVTGFRNSFETWTLARKIDDAPKLNGRFIQMDSSRDDLSRSFSVQTGDVLKVFAEVDMTVYRQISQSSIPRV